ncbi:EAL domain-containing protein [Bacillus luteolus]|uniref:EAL domain-containing protein n=1 Tax=Litchfieldia luteola TaxID=682179 RepID=A0ABR9QLX3_9BACI|nr:EAL domain-containing protein [Cytobacillus luteolus]MBE4909406.1 EAL domain-containing protein [Cytobacillus luteolus]MBP1940805.1 EAL domain-containing protein (putative c-di-GMP-specific phosphodiesterase class I) [Cytobacillus luteolus]
MSIAKILMEDPMDLDNHSIITMSHKRNEFRDILKNKAIKILFQPIVCLQNGEIHGYEALSRGPENSEFHYPSSLFSFAEREGFLYPLEKVAREQALYQSKHLLDNQKLFINLTPQVIHDPHFTPGHTISLLEQYQMNPENIVFEITERSAITDFQAFKVVLNHYRAQGFKIAIDDAGAGYSSLQAISELEPDYIKVDRSLISGVDKNEVKKNILEAFVMFAKKMNSKVLAEGIETFEELEKVKELGIDFGQGYYLARPNNPVPPFPRDIKEFLRSDKNKKKPIYVDINDEIVILNNGKELARTFAKFLL